MTPQSALAELKAGNARFVARRPLHRDFPTQVKATASDQYPFAVVLSCADSRQPVEIVLDQGIGDIFSARIAGNVVDDDVLGSMEFACKLSGAKLIAVIGHSNCGAIKGAIDNVQLGNLTGLLAKGPGFDTSSLLSFAIAPLQNGYSRVDASRLVRRLDEQVRALPVARSSAAARFAFLNGGAWSNNATIQTDRRIVSDRSVNFNAVSPGFFATLGVRLLAGRDFDQRDSRPGGEIGPRCAIVNQAFVKRYLAGRDPLGVRIARGGGPDVKPNSPIVGVVADMSYRGLRDNSEQVFFPLFEHDDTGATFYIKVRGAPEQAIPSIRRLVRQDDPGLPILWFRTLDDEVNRSLSTERLLAALSGSFGALALLLSLIGLYGVIAYNAARRAGEVGVRIALGATRGDVVRLVLKGAFGLILAGLSIGLPLTFAAGRLLGNQLYGMSPYNPVVTVASVLALGFSALVACIVPALRASLISPLDALRVE
jgi:predicted permease